MITIDIPLQLYFLCQQKFFFIVPLCVQGTQFEGISSWSRSQGGGVSVNKTNY